MTLVFEISWVTAIEVSIMNSRNKLGMSTKQAFCVLLGLWLECSSHAVSGMRFRV